MNRWKINKGFTIVELLIVVVVIAILAAITIVSFNGVTQRAKESAAQSASSQATKRLAAYAVDNSDLYPIDKSAFMSYANLQEGDGTGSVASYQYRGASDQKSYCLTVTTNSISYFTTNTTQNPQKGACAGHAVNGGVAVTNYVLNPKFAVDTSTWTMSPGSGGVATFTRIATGGPSGVVDSFSRTEWTTTGTSPGVVDAGRPLMGGGAPVSPNTTYVPSLYVRSTVAMGVYVDSIVYNSSGTVLLDSPNASVTLPANTWTRVVGASFVTPSASAGASIRLVTNNSGVASGVKIDVTAAMISLGSDVPAYADGDNAGWIWNGTSNGSTSTGPKQ